MGPLVNRLSVRFCPPNLFSRSSYSFNPTIVTPSTLVSFYRTEFVGFKVVISRRQLSSSVIAKAGWLMGFTNNERSIPPKIVNAGDPVLNERAMEVDPSEISSERIQKIIDDMIRVMRKAPGVGLAAPQIGIPLRVSTFPNINFCINVFLQIPCQIITLEDTKEYISYGRKEEIKAQERRPFDLLVIVNPELTKKSEKTALFFEGCLSVDGFRAVVERHLEVEVKGLDRNGRPLKVDAYGWQARILQHECDHLDGVLYVDKMTPRTFRTSDNLDLPLAEGCPPMGVK